MQVMREDGEEPKFWQEPGLWAVQTLGKGACLGPVPAGLLGSGKGGILGNERPVDQHTSQPGMVCAS